MKKYLIVIALTVAAGCSSPETIQEETTVSAAPASEALASEVAQTAPADLIMTNGQVKTASGWAEAVAIRDGKILVVGDADSVLAARGDNTEIIDLGGQVVLPGFHDMHVHPLHAGIRQTECQIAQGSNLEQMQGNVAGCVELADAGDWITGGQWDASALGQSPTVAMLDAVSPDNPVLLNDTSGHSALANSAALKLANITKDTADPEGGIIERNGAGEPTGVLRESAILLVAGLAHLPTKAELRPAMKWSLNTMLSYGITSFTEASLGFVGGLENEAEVYVALADEGFLKHRARLCLTWAPGNEEAETVIAARQTYARDRLAVDCVKIFLDGVPTDSHTAAMLEPYAGTVAGREDEASRKGLLLIEQEALNTAVTRFDKMGLTVKFHAAGDAAVRAGLNAIEAAREANGPSGLRHNVGHCTFVSREDIPRAAALNATFELSPYLWSPSPINDDITSAIGAERIKRIWPFKDIVESDALVVAGSDWAVVPSVNPWIAVEALVTRREPGGSAAGFGESQAISVEQAIDLFTINSAKHMGRDDVLGQIEAGMLADIIVVDQNPYDVSRGDLHKTKVVMTFIEGEKVFSASE